MKQALYGISGGLVAGLLFLSILFLGPLSNRQDAAPVQSQAATVSAVATSSAVATDSAVLRNVGGTGSQLRPSDRTFQFDLRVDDVDLYRLHG